MYYCTRIQPFNHQHECPIVELIRWPLAPPDMSNMSQNVSQVSSRAIRSSQSNQLYVPRRDLRVDRQSLRNSGAVLYNTLDSNIKESQSLASFKYKAFKHFM